MTRVESHYINCRAATSNSLKHRILGLDRTTGLIFIIKIKIIVLVGDAKPLKDTLERNCHFLFTSKGLNRKRARVDRRQGKHWSFK